MCSLFLFGDGGAAKPAAPAPKTPRPAQGLFGAEPGKAAAPLPKPAHFGRC